MVAGNGKDAAGIRRIFPVRNADCEIPVGEVDRMDWVDGVDAKGMLRRFPSDIHATASSMFPGLRSKMARRRVEFFAGQGVVGGS